MSETSELLGELDIFYVNEIMKFDYKVEELAWGNKIELGSVSFGKMYKTKIKKKDNRPVAIKVYYYLSLMTVYIYIVSKLNKTLKYCTHCTLTMSMCLELIK